MMRRIVLGAAGPLVPPSRPANLNRAGAVCRRRRMSEGWTTHQRVAPAAAEPAQLAVEEDVDYPDLGGHFLPDNSLRADAVADVWSAFGLDFLNVERVVSEGDPF